MDVEEWKKIVEIIDSTQSLTIIATCYISDHDDDKAYSNLENILKVITKEIDSLSKKVRALPIK